MMIKHRLLPPLEEDKYYFLKVCSLGIIGTGDDIVTHLDIIINDMLFLSKNLSIVVGIQDLPKYYEQRLPLNHIEFHLN